jgi:hypothetical protein
VFFSETLLALPASQGRRRPGAQIRTTVHLPARRALVAVLALAMMMTLSGSAAAAPAFRDRARLTRPNPEVVMRGSGWGHGVGMSQYGAYAQAKAGRTYKQILQHYYSGVTVGRTSMPASVRVGLAQALPFSNVEAVNGPIPWRVCANGNCKTVRKQPAGTTWTVSLTSTGEYQLRNGTTVKWTGAGDRLLGAFNPHASGDGTLIKAYSPNGDRRFYKWGRLEYSVAKQADRTMFMVLEIPSIELYLRGLGEMPFGWGAAGLAALKAQATTARSYAVIRHRSANGNRSACRCSVYATTADQVYNGYDKELEDTSGYWRAAVDGTAGIVPLYNGAPIEALYSSSHGGRSENSQDSYAFTGTVPYLRSVVDPWSTDPSSGNPNISWTFPLANSTFANFVGGLAQVRRVRVVGDRTAGGTPRTVRVWGLDSSGNAVVRDRVGDVREAGIVGATLKYRFGPGLKSQQIRRFGFQPFTDDDGKPHEYASLYAYSAGIMDDASAPTFGPGRSVTRGRAALYLYRTFQLPAPTKSYYGDIADRPAAERTAINALAQAGIAEVPKNGAFRPTNVLTRAQAAWLFRNALGMSRRNTATDYFIDDTGLKAEPAINRMARRGLMGGCGSQKFCPGRAMTRGQMATLLLRTVEAYR